MKRLFSCFLFQKRPAEGLSARRRALFWLWNYLLAAGSGAVLGILSLTLATGQHSWAVFWDYWGHPALLILNLLPPVVLALLLYGATGRTWLACALTALPVMGLALGNYYKLAFRDHPAIAADLLILGEAGQMAGKYPLFLSPKLAGALIGAALAVAVPALLARGRPRGRARALTALAALACAAALVPAYGSDRLYNSQENYAHLDRWSSTQQYISRGLLYPFLHSVKDALPHPPEGYSEKEAAALLAQYEDGDIPADKKVNIVGVMLESFADLSGYEQIEFKRDVYAALHALEEESYSGRLLTNIFAGGTIDTERAFLTGMEPDSINYRADTSSYVWYLKGQGYEASGFHPSNDWFYNRKNVNAYLGFDQYYFRENYYDGNFADCQFDYVFFPTLAQAVLGQLEHDAPQFSFSVSYQGHGPYDDSVCWWGEVDDFIGNHDLPQDQRTILANYLGSVYSTQIFLSEFVDALRASDEPVVLVVFGDHKPWLGSGNAVYKSLGISLDRSTEEGFYNYWSTGYFIWANNAAKRALGRNIVGEGPDISPCFLMNVLFERLGWEGDAYMQAVEPLRRELPVIHNSGAVLTPGGGLVLEPSGEQAEQARRFRALEYYRARHFSGKTG